MFKVASPALKHPGSRNLADFHRYWAESHGPLFSNTKHLRRYVQHLTLPEAYENDPKPTWDGLSMFWYDTVDGLVVDSSSPPDAQALRTAVIEDDRQLFDRLPGWPLAQKRASVVAEEHVILDGETTPEMVKALFVVSRRPGLTHQEFFEHWEHVNGPLTAKLPGLRRYLQNHTAPAALGVRPMTHDGFSELWFDDYASFLAATKSPEWAAMKADDATLFGEPVGLVIARERIQKEIDVPLTGKDALTMTEEEILSRLKDQGYKTLAADAAAPKQIKEAALRGELMVWTAEHLLAIDGGHIEIDARPERQGI